MPAHSEAFKNAVLDGTWATLPWVIRLWHDRPSNVSPSEADFDGYTPATVEDGWDPADGGARSTTDLVDMGTPAGADTDASRYWALHDPDTDELAFSAKLQDPVYVTASDNPVLIRPTVLFA